jgi:hypothetical protein
VPVARLQQRNRRCKMGGVECWLLKRNNFSHALSRAPQLSYVNMTETQLICWKVSRSKS